MYILLLLLLLSPQYAYSHCKYLEMHFLLLSSEHAVLTKKKKSTCQIFYSPLHYYKITLCMMSNEQCCNAVTAC